MENLWRYAVVGNIKKSRIDENGILRYGTSAFKGGTRVYIYGRKWDERLTENNKTDIFVVGLSRGRSYYACSVPIDLIDNVRVARVYSTKLLEIMSNHEFSDGWWGSSQEERRDAYAFVKKWNDKYKSKY